MQVPYENTPHNFYFRDTEHNAAPFRCGRLGCNPHLHYEIELAFIWEGRTIATIDSNEYEVGAGDIVIAFPNQIHFFKTIDDEKYALMKFNPDLIPELVQRISASLPVSNIIKGAAKDSELDYAIRQISNAHYSNEPYKDVIIRGYLLAFFGKLLSKLELREIQSGDYKVLGMIMNYCAQNFDKDLTLDTLEHDLHLNKYYISHIINNKLHIRFNEYINSLRVSSACAHLEKSELTVTEISEAVGFNTLRTFNRAFMKQIGCTPTQYRQSKKKGINMIS